MITLPYITTNIADDVSSRSRLSQPNLGFLQ